MPLSLAFSSEHPATNVTKVVDIPLLYSRQIDVEIATLIKRFDFVKESLASI